MKRWVLQIAITFLMVLGLSIAPVDNANAYTEEQKAQAKAWLSAHGYSPDMDGAGQAYQDYLNGKFDEELGVDVNGDGFPATGDNATTQTTTEEYTDAEHEEAVSGDETQTLETDIQGGNVSGDFQSTEGQVDVEVSGDASENSLDTTSNDTEGDTGSTELAEGNFVPAEAVEEDVTGKPYNEAVIVIILLAVCTCVVAVLLSLRRK